ncbi:protein DETOXIFICATION 27-like [Setaria viridis]|uniref:protein DETOXIFICATION 27-like n=1 Tax=Setaria viridis TaxID=4556 RepID=UPI003B3B3FDA
MVGPAIFNVTATYSMTVLMHALAGHLELESVSIANTVLVGFNYGLILGMASALETLCGQAFGAGRHAMLGVYMQRSWIVLLAYGYFLVEAALLAAGQPPELSAMAGRAAVLFVPMHFAFALLFLLRRFLQCQGKNWVASAAAAAGLCVHGVVTWLLEY